MISKRVQCKAKNDNYGRLANYIADASHAGEKSLMHWTAGTWAGNDYDLSIQEVLDTQSLNTRTKKEKTYHLVVSFRTEDEGKLTEEDFKAIEARFAKVLGFEEHQRHCGVHINTDNMHMHVAYNMIHPEKLTRHESYHDFYKRDELCRALEKEYNLSIDNGIDPLSTEYKLTDKSAKKEALTGEESFETYTQRQHDSIVEQIEKANSWEDVHTVFALYGMELKVRGNGMAIKNKKGKQMVKASKFDKDFSYKKLTDRFGGFMSVSEKTLQETKAKDWYKRKPVHEKSLAQKALWETFIAEQKKEREENTEQKKQEIEAIKATYREKQIKNIIHTASKTTANMIAKKIKMDQAQAINDTHLKYATQTQKTWQDFLQEKALLGDENALEVLRSNAKNAKERNLATIMHELKTKKKIYEPKNILKKKKTNEYIKNLQENSDELAQKKQIVSNINTNNKEKQLQMNQYHLRKVFKETFQTKIARNGTIIFELQNGGKILDNGKKISFSDKAKAIALDYATAKFGKKQLTAEEKERVNTNAITFEGLGKNQDLVQRDNKEQQKTASLIL